MQRLGGDQEGQITDVLTSPERTVYAKVFCDWNGTGKYDHPLSDLSPYIESVSVDRSLSGSAPEELMLIEGAAAAELTLELSGTYKGMPLDSVFSPYNSYGPFYMRDLPGAVIYYRLYVNTPIGLAPYQQFIGYVRTLKPVRGEGSVSITALDYSEDLRLPITAPPWAIDLGNANHGIVKAQLINSAWVIDNALRQCDVSPTPFRPVYQTDNPSKIADDLSTGCQLWVSNSGSLIPTVGYTTRQYLNTYCPLDNTLPEFYEQRGPSQHYGQGTLGDALPLIPASKGENYKNHVSYWVRNRDAVSPNFVHQMALTLNLKGEYNGNLWSETGHDFRVFWVELSDHIQIDIHIGGGSVRSTYRITNTNLPEDWENATVYTSPSIDLTPHADGEYIRLRVYWVPVNQSRFQVRIEVEEDGGAKQVYGPYATNVPFPNVYVGDSVRRGICTIDDCVSISDVCYAQSDSEEASNISFLDLPSRRAASLDRGLQDFSYMPVYKAEDAWELITEVAAAEWGSVFWNEAGAFRFWNYDTLLELQKTTARTYSLDEISGLEFEVSLDSVRNIYSVETGKSTSSYGTLYASDNVDEFLTPGKTTKTFTMKVDKMLSPNPYPPGIYQNERTDGGNKPSWTDEILHGVVYQFDRDDGEGFGEVAGRDPQVNCPVRAFFDMDTNLVVSVENNYAETVRLATGFFGGDAQPACRIGGTLMDEYDTIVTSVTNPESIRQFRPRNYNISGDWYQDHSDLGELLRRQLPRTVRPIPTTQAITAPGDPRIQLGDCIDIKDRDGFGGTLKMQILGINRTYQPDGGLSDQYTVELIRLSRLGLWDDPDYGLWDSSFIWSD